MGNISKDISNMHGMLFDQGIHLVTCFELTQIDESANEITVTEDYLELVKEHTWIIPMWLSFSAGYELLFKAILMKHAALNITKAGASKLKKEVRKEGGNFSDAMRVVDFVSTVTVAADSNSYIRKKLVSQSIQHLYDVKTGTLGGILGSLKQLNKSGVITDNERYTIHNATLVLLSLRRNVDAHTFYGFTVGKSINGDLVNLYVPALNIMRNKYLGTL